VKKKGEKKPKKQGGLEEKWPGGRGPNELEVREAARGGKKGGVEEPGKRRTSVEKLEGRGPVRPKGQSWKKAAMDRLILEV